MTTASATAIVRQSVFLGGDSGVKPRQKSAPPGDSAPLSLLDILPAHRRIAAESRDSWQSLKEINAAIIKRLTLQQNSTE